MKTIPNIISLIYQHRIQTLCQNLFKQCGFKYFVSYIVFNNGQTFVLSNLFHLLIPYYTEDFYKQDFNFKKEITIDVTHYLCDKSLSVSKAFAEILQERFKVFRAYYIVRNAPECQFIFGAIKDTPFNDFAYIYKRTLDKFEDFCCDFTDAMLDVIKLYNPTYASSVILNDPRYRRMIIKSLYANHKLTFREIECLSLTAQGKTSEETANILGINKSTVETHRDAVKRKLNAANMAQAVFEGMKLGYIGAFDKSWHKKDTYALNNISILENSHNGQQALKQNNLWLLNQ